MHICLPRFSKNKMYHQVLDHIPNILFIIISISTFTYYFKIYRLTLSNCIILFTFSMDHKSVFHKNYLTFRTIRDKDSNVHLYLRQSRWYNSETTEMFPDSARVIASLNLSLLLVFCGILQNSVKSPSFLQYFWLYHIFVDSETSVLFYSALPWKNFSISITFFFGRIQHWSVYHLAISKLCMKYLNIFNLLPRKKKC